MDHVLFPRFWIEEPALWFAQIEAVFALNNVTSDTDKYDYILCELPSTVISLVKNIILDTSREHDNGKYQRVKNEVIKTISIAELEKEEVGSMRPSEFLKYLRQKADIRISEEVVKGVWLKKLPLHVSCLVSDLKGDLETVCKLADAVIEYLPKPNRDKMIENLNIASVNDVSDVTRILVNLGAQLEFIQTEFLKFKLLYTENNTQLESIQSELNKFKISYNDNNERLDFIKTELEKIKLALYSGNNNDRALCNTCEKEKSINSEDRRSIIDESNSTDCKDDETNNSF